MESNDYGSKGNTLPIALTIVMLAIYALFRIVMFTAIPKVFTAILGN